ncbi:EboA domain-containing protein [Compostimonas suwonensis]|uniref:Sugar phosphate isomerase n=1 Tax=Compostimonas suwonensis TaxID=1048394 RepID=A0A2M9BTZ5_9MICO|nr:EboA domain-containing protein [Compostimonas suwonensis]PJJ61426.1 hypothetical protein CLV54_2371 [Compostimonas suwonensis]
MPDIPSDGWVARAQAVIANDPASISRFFAQAGRAVGREAVEPAADPTGIVHGTRDDLARVALVVSLSGALDDAPLATELESLYRHGDNAERRGVLLGLGALDTRPAGLVEGEVVAAGVELAKDALRANDPRLVASALGDFGARHLDDHSWRHGVLKLVFMDAPLASVAGLDGRYDDELDRMLGALDEERRAAGRTTPDDVVRLRLRHRAQAPTRAQPPQDQHVHQTKGE